MFSAFEQHLYYFSGITMTVMLVVTWSEGLGTYKCQSVSS